MARSTKGLYKRNQIWWMTYRDALGRQRFESCRTQNKKDAEQRLIDRRKEGMESMVLAAPAHHIEERPMQRERILSWV